MAGTAFGNLAMSLFVAGAIFGDLGTSLFFVATAAFGDLGAPADWHRKGGVRKVSCLVGPIRIVPAFLESRPLLWCMKSNCCNPIRRREFVCSHTDFDQQCFLSDKKHAKKHKEQ